MNAPPPAAALPLGKKIAFAACATFLALGGAELALRLGGFAYAPRQPTLWVPTTAGFQGTYEFFIPTQLAPPGYVWLAEPNTPYTDRRGFRLPELPDRKEPGKIRIAFLGGSTTQGGYRPYPERTVAILNAACGTNRYEALNAACSSYSTHQSLIVLQRLVLALQPDLICLYHGWNDAQLQTDGFRDDAKDALAARASAPRALGSALRRLRLAQAMGKWLDLVRRPEPRVPPERFRGNLERFADACAGQGVPALLFTRPAWRRDPPAALGPDMAAYYAARHRTPDEREWRAREHAECVAIQREVATRKGLALFDASQVVADLETRRQAGEFGPDVQIYQPDGLHLTPFGEQRLAEALALQLAGADAARVRALIGSAAHLAELARTSLADVRPFEAAFYADAAQGADPTADAEMDACRAQAEALFEFARLFEDAKWGGSDPVFDSKLAKLRRCLELRPHDVGVAVQMLRVCAFQGRTDLAADLMRGFQPTNAVDFLRWKGMEFQSHAEGQRWDAAAQTARDVLAADPGNSQAQAFLDRFQGARGP